MPHTHLFLIALLAMATTAAADEPRTITVDGSGFATIAPDMAHVRMSIVERDARVATAQAAAAEVTRRTLQLTDKLGIPRKKVNTTGATVSPDYRWNRETEQQELVGYIAERSIEVELEELDKLGDLIEGAVQAGINQINPPALDSSKRREIYRQALTLAAEDARDNAATLAAALGARLGAVATVNAMDGGSGPPPAPMYRVQADMAMAESAPASYSAGDIRFDARVNAVFFLLD